MKLVSLENLSKYNELLNQKTVKSVNSITPDSNGNVALNIVKSINGNTPGANGDVELDTVSDITFSGKNLNIESTTGNTKTLTLPFSDVKTVNNVQPDSNGNIEITIPEVDLSGLVKSVNNIHPDESGNISLNVFTTPGNIIKWETDYFDIAPNGLYSFDLSNTPFANIPREAINIQMVGKVKTAQNGFKVDDYVYPQFANYNGNTGSTEQGSTPYISGNVLSIRFGNELEFVVPGPNGAVMGINKINIKVKLILTALIKEV